MLPNAFVFLIYIVSKNCFGISQNRRSVREKREDHAACKIADQAGCFAIVLDVMSDGDDDAFERRMAWYSGFGFQTFVSDPARMFMVMKQVRGRVLSD